jgi:hypothetical protein
MSDAKKPSAAEIKIAHAGEQLLAPLAKFVKQAGGIKRTHQAIESLEKLKKAA